MFEWLIKKLLGLLKRPSFYIYVSYFAALLAIILLTLDSSTFSFSDSKGDSVKVSINAPKISIVDV